MPTQTSLIESIGDSDEASKSQSDSLSEEDTPPDAADNASHRLIPQSEIIPAISNSDSERVDSTGLSETTTVYEHAKRKSWVDKKEDTGQPYAFVAAKLVVQNTISSTAATIKVETKRQTADTAYAPHSSVSFSGVSKSQTIAQFVSTLASTILGVKSYPRHEDGRHITGDDMRVFIAPPIEDLLLATADDTHDAPAPKTVRDWLKTVKSLPNSLPENELNPDQESILKSWAVARERAGIGATANSVDTQVKRVEQTLRSKLGFTTKFGSSVPDPHPEYEELPLAELKMKLDALKAAYQYEQQAYYRIDERLKQRRHEWINQMATNHLSDPVAQSLTRGV